MPFLSSISWSGMPTGGFCQGIRWVTEFGQANGTSPAWARWGISLDRRGLRGGGRPGVGKKDVQPEKKERRADGGPERDKKVEKTQAVPGGKPIFHRPCLAFLRPRRGK